MFNVPKADYNGLCSYSIDLDFTPLFLSDNVNFIWLYLKNIILTGMNCFTPKVRLRKYQYPCWFTPELRHLSKCVRTLKRQISKNPATNQLLKLKISMPKVYILSMPQCTAFRLGGNAWGTAHALNSGTPVRAFRSARSQYKEPCIRTITVRELYYSLPN